MNMSPAPLAIIEISLLRVPISIMAADNQALLDFEGNRREVDNLCIDNEYTFL